MTTGTDYGRLVERLHAVAERDWRILTYVGDVAKEAADAITALKARVEELEAALDDIAERAKRARDGQLHGTWLAGLLAIEITARRTLTQGADNGK